MRATPLRSPYVLTVLLIASSLTLVCGCGTTNGYVHNRMGMAYYKRGKQAAAREQFRLAVLDNPQNPSYRYNLAAAAHRQGDVMTAERVYRDAINVDPGHQPAYHGLAKLMHQQGRTAEATELLENWRGIEPYSAKPHIELASLQRETGDVVAAERSLREALKAQPRHPVAMAQLGQIYQDTGQVDRATAMYQGSLQNQWNQSEVHSRLATMPRPHYAAAPPMAGRTAMGQPFMMPPPAGYAQNVPYGMPTYAPAYADNSAVLTRPVIVQPATPGPPSFDAGDPAHTSEANLVPPPQD